MNKRECYRKGRDRQKETVIKSTKKRKRKITPPHPNLNKKLKKGGVGLTNQLIDDLTDQAHTELMHAI